MAEQTSSPTCTRRVLDRLNKSRGKQPFRYQVEVIPAIVGGLPPSVESVSVTMERGAKVAYTDPAAVEKSSRAAKFRYTMKQTTTMYLETGVFTPKEYVLKVKSHSLADASRPARTIGRTRLDLASFCTPSTQPYSEELMVALKPTGCVTLHITTQLLGGCSSETSTPRARDEISELSFSSAHAPEEGVNTPRKLPPRTQSITGDIAAFGGGRVGSVTASRPGSRQGSVTSLRKGSAATLRRGETDFADESYPAIKDNSACSSPQATPRTSSITAASPRRNCDSDAPGPGPSSRKQQAPPATSPRNRSPLGADASSTPPHSPRSPSPRPKPAPASTAPETSSLSVHRRSQSVTFPTRAGSDAVVRSRLLTLVAAEVATQADIDPQAPPAVVVGTRGGSMTALAEAGGVARVASAVVVPPRSASASAPGSQTRVGSWTAVDVAALKEGVDTLRADSDTIKASHMVSRGCSALGPDPALDMSEQSIKQRVTQAAQSSSAELAVSIDNENSIRAVRAIARHLLHERDDWRDRCRAAEHELQLEQERACQLQARLDEASARAAAAEASLGVLQEAPLVRHLVEAKVALAQADLNILGLQGQLSQERRTTRQLSARLLTASALCEWTDSDEEDFRGGASTPEPRQLRARPQTAEDQQRAGGAKWGLMTAPAGSASAYAPRVRV